MKNYIKVVVPDMMYFGGDVVCGVVELNATKRFRCKAIRLLFAGFEFAIWNENRGNSSVHFQQRRIFLTHRFDLMGSMSDEKKDFKIDVQPGLYRFPFAIALPLFIPPSCKLTHGRIEYNLSAFIDNSFSYDMKHVVRLRIGGNLFSELDYSKTEKQITATNNKSFLFAAGKLKVEVTTPKLEYFVGDTLPIQVSMVNDSKKKVDSIKVFLIVIERYYADDSKRSVHYIRHKQSYPANCSGKSRSVATLDYVIPDDIPTMATYERGSPWHPKMVHLYHHIRVCVDVPWALDLVIEVPVNIMRVNPRASIPPLNTTQERQVQQFEQHQNIPAHHLSQPNNRVRSFDPQMMEALNLSNNPSYHSFITPPASQESSPAIPHYGRVRSDTSPTPHLPSPSLSHPSPTPSHRPVSVMIPPSALQYIRSSPSSSPTTAPPPPFASPYPPPSPSLTQAPPNPFTSIPEISAVPSSSSSGHSSRSNSPRPASPALRVPPSSCIIIPPMQLSPLPDVDESFYPVLDNFTFPKDTEAVLVAFGEYTLDKRDERLFH